MGSNIDLEEGSRLDLDLVALSLTTNQGRSGKAVKQISEDRISKASRTAVNVNDTAEQGKI